jgi:hypothetical protein
VSPPRVHAVLNVGKRVFVFDDAPARRRPKQPLGTAVAKGMLGGRRSMRQGLVWLVEPEQVASPVDFTVARETTACLDAGEQRLLLGFADAAKQGADPEWYEVVELSKCETVQPPQDDPLDWTVLDANKYKKLPFAFFDWQSIAIEGDHGDARYKGDLAEVPEKEAAPIAQRLDKYRNPLTVQSEKEVLFRIGMSDLVFSRVAPSNADWPDLRDVPAMSANVLTHERDTLFVITPNSILASATTALQGGIELGDRRFLVVGIANLDPPLRLLEVTRDKLLDAGPFMGVRTNAR